MQIIETKILSNSGIYCIINIKNGKRYIGSSKNILSRLLKHRSLLRGDYHNNQYLQNSYNKHGEKYFIISILEFCEEKELTIKEQFWIDECNPEFNLTREVIRNTLSPISRLKQSQTRKELYKLGIIKPSRITKIKQFDHDGNFIKEWNSIKEAAYFNKIHICTIIRCAKHRAVQGSGYIWRYTNDISEIISIKGTKRTKFKDLVKQEELLGTPTLERQKEDNQQPSLDSNILEGSTTNTQILPNNVGDSNGNTSILPSKIIIYKCDENQMIDFHNELIKRSDDIV